MATQYPTEQEEHGWEIERLQEGFKEFIAVRVRDLEDNGILTREQAQKVREAFVFKQ